MPWFAPGGLRGRKIKVAIIEPERFIVYDRIFFTGGLPALELAEVNYGREVGFWRKADSDKQESVS